MPSLALIALGVMQLRPETKVVRDSFGIPAITAATEQDAFRAMGYAVAQDRMWQMELSRRLARGKLAEVMGAAYAAADRETLKTGYTDAELDAQFAALPPDLRTMYVAYSEGVNDRLRESLPKEYATNGFRPENWTVLDSLAINVSLLQRFGRGGAGELRNLLLLKYAETKPTLKDRKFDFFDDFVFTESGGLATLTKGDDPGNRVPFPKWNRSDTIRQYNALPNLGLLELAGAVRLATRENTQLVADRISAPFYTGSYAVVVAPKQSQNGSPLLLSGPQMGFQNPSIVHQIRIDTPSLKMEGMDVPGVPGVLVGTTPYAAWGLTTGVADTEDIVVVRDETKLRQETATLRVKGKADETVTRLYVGPDPVVLRKPGLLLVQKSAFRGREIASGVALTKLWRARSASEMDAALQSATMNFNGFWATKDGHIGWRYCGLYPVRSNNLDPRLPIEASQAWTTVATAAQMPHVIDPKSGVIFNWNNRPTEWWPNSDTPAWGPIFRNSALSDALGKGPYNIQRLERAAWQIARTDETWPYFAKFAGGDPQLKAFDGWMLDGSYPASYYRTWQDQVRRELLLPVTGDFLGESNFRLVAQPSVVWKALNGKTKLDYRQGRDVAGLAAANLAGQSVAPYVPGSMPSPDGIRIPYSNRGTFIQLVELVPDGIRGRNVAPPGIAESGEHDRDQANLARTWTFRPMVGWPSNPR